MWAPSWSWIVAANVLLGVNQGLAWSTTVVMKIDLVGPERRGFAMGLNEFAGYLAVALSALATGEIASRFGLRPEPFYLGIAFVALGLGMSLLFVRDTTAHARHEAGGDGQVGACRRRATRARPLCDGELARPRALQRQSGRPREQPERRARVGTVPTLFRRVPGSRCARSACWLRLPGDVGYRASSGPAR